MLEGIEDIDWGSLKHAYGSAKHTPTHIVKLASDIPADWLEAIDALWATINHQGSIYSATPYVVPFLIELAGAPRIRCRAQILELLASIASGRSYLEAHEPYSFRGKRDTPEFQAMLAAEISQIRSSWAAVWRGLDLYLALLTDEEPRLRLSAGYTIGTLCQIPRDGWPEENREGDGLETIVAAVRRQIARETDELAKAGHLFAPGALAGQARGAAEELRRQLVDPSSPPVELAAAMNLAANPESVPVEAIDALTRSLMLGEEIEATFRMDEPSGEDRHHPPDQADQGAGFPSVENDDDDDIVADESFRFPWIDSFLQGKLIGLLCALPREHFDRLLPALLSALHDRSPYRVDSIAGPILSYLFEGGKLSATATVSDLTPAQRAVLEILVDIDEMFEPSNGNCHFAFMNVGPSHSRWEWERLLDRPGWRADTEEHILANLDRFIRHSSIDRITKEVKAPAPERLTFLNLDCIFHGDAYLPYLGPFKKLEVLRLCQSGVTDAGLQSLPDLPELREIYLNATSVTDAGAATLARFPKLEMLFATKTGITDEGI